MITKINQFDGKSYFCKKSKFCTPLLFVLKDNTITKIKVIPCVLRRKKFHPHFYIITVKVFLDKNRKAFTLSAITAFKTIRTFYVNNR